MAKKYIRINFEDRPSTRSPIDATNLNKIDAAVDELDTWRDSLIVDNVASTLTDKALSAKQGKLLNDKVTTLNESLSVIMDCGEFKTPETVFDFVKNAKQQQLKFVTSQFYPSDLPIQTEGWISVFIDKSTNRRICRLIPYDVYAPIYQRSFFSGSWLSTWIIANKSASTLIGSTSNVGWQFFDINELNFKSVTFLVKDSDSNIVGTATLPIDILKTSSTLKAIRLESNSLINCYCAYQTGQVCMYSSDNTRTVTCYATT